MFDSNLIKTTSFTKPEGVQNSDQRRAILKFILTSLKCISFTIYIEEEGVICFLNSNYWGKSAQWKRRALLRYGCSLLLFSSRIRFGQAADFGTTTLFFLFFAAHGWMPRTGPTWAVVGKTVGVLDRQTYQEGTRGCRLCGEERDRETENSKVCARTRDTRFIHV
jgi:hypothetical protein